MQIYFRICCRCTSGARKTCSPPAPHHSWVEYRDRRRKSSSEIGEGVSWNEVPFLTFGENLVYTFRRAILTHQSIGSDMRFLVITKSRAAAPPDPSIVDAMTAWLEQHKDRMEQSWAFAGVNGGGGILNVDSLEELDEVMTGFPLGQFSTIEVYGLADLRRSLDNLRTVMSQMGGSPG